MGPKKKKKQPRNAFWFFMQDEMKKLGLEGKTWNNMAELVQICSPRWAEVTPEEKQRYEHMARKKKEEDRLDLSSRFDHQGRSLLDIENERKERERTEMDMLRDIEDTVKAAFATGTIVKEKFFFIHFNALCTTVDGRHLPCELAVAEFSLLTGCSRLFHAFVRPPPDSIPMGSAYYIKKTAEESHKLDLYVEPMCTESASNHAKIADSLLSLLGAGSDTGPPPPLYTMKDDEEKVLQLLSDLFSWAGRPADLIRSLRVYHVHELFFQLSNEVGPSILKGFRDAAQIKLQSEEFLYCPNLACPFHEEVDRPAHCSRFAVRNWCYLLSDTLCQFYDVDPIPGRHLPADDATADAAKPEILGEEIDEQWEIDGDLKESGEQLTPFGVVRTKAQPAGHSMPVNVAAMQRMTLQESCPWKPQNQDGDTASRSTGHSVGSNLQLDDSQFPSLGQTGAARKIPREQGGYARQMNNVHKWKQLSS